MGERHAVVIGSGIAGLLAARVLGEHVDRVTVIDRDRFPATPEHRAGAPQSQHAHALLPAGAEIAYRLFPGLFDELLADGAADATIEGLRFVTPQGLLPLVPRAGRALVFSRYLLEWRLRDHLGRDDAVTFRPSTEVVGLLGGERVTGLRVRGRSGRPEEIVEADLVVDTSGRRSPVVDWLAELGYGPVPEETLTSELSYASRFYARPPGFPDEFCTVIVNGRPPHTPRAGLVQLVDGDRWHVTVGGLAGTAPPTDEDGFLRFAASLADPSVYEAIRVARPLTPIRGWRTPTSRWRHFERMTRRPRGLVVLGDAVAALNPLYGQGMTVAAREAIALQETLRDHDGGRRAGFEERVQARVARTVTAAWAIASAEDLRWPGVRLHGARPPRGMALVRRYLDVCTRAAVDDPALAMRLLDLITMDAGPGRLVAPPALVRVARHALGRRLRPGGGAERFAMSPQALADARAMPAWRDQPDRSARGVPSPR